MKRLYVLSLVFVLPACGGGGDDSTTPVPVPDASTDASVHDASPSSTPDATVEDAGRDAAPADAGEVSDAELDAGEGDSGCPSSWYVAPDVDPTIAVPDGGGHVILHAVGTGTQDYVCEVTTPTDGAAPSYTWTLVSPVARLSDCNDAIIGNHFASTGGSGFPEWQTLDGTYLVGAKNNAGVPSDAGAVAWLLLHAVDAGGDGALGHVNFVQRLNTVGGVASAPCDADHVNASAIVPYTADYYFFGD